MGNKHKLSKKKIYLLLSLMLSLIILLVINQYRVKEHQYASQLLQILSEQNKNIRDIVLLSNQTIKKDAQTFNKLIEKTNNYNDALNALLKGKELQFDNSLVYVDKAHDAHDEGKLIDDILYIWQPLFSRLKDNAYQEKFVHIAPKEMTLLDLTDNVIYLLSEDVSSQTKFYDLLLFSINMILVVISILLVGNNIKYFKDLDDLATKINIIIDSKNYKASLKSKKTILPIIADYFNILLETLEKNKKENDTLTDELVIMTDRLYVADSSKKDVESEVIFSKDLNNMQTVINDSIDNVNTAKAVK